ncbi:MAG: glycosyltransferase family 1 protein, partial [Caldiserica bacterium]
GGISEIVKDEITGLLFEVENFYELSQKICYLLDNPEKIIEMGKNGRRYLEENFSFDKMKETLLKLYKEI